MVKNTGLVVNRHDIVHLMKLLAVPNSSDAVMRDTVDNLINNLSLTTKQELAKEARKELGYEIEQGELPMLDGETAIAELENTYHIWGKTMGNPKGTIVNRQDLEQLMAAINDPSADEEFITSQSEKLIENLPLATKQDLARSIIRDINEEREQPDCPDASRYDGVEYNLRNKYHIWGDTIATTEYIPAGDDVRFAVGFKDPQGDIQVLASETSLDKAKLTAEMLVLNPGYRQLEIWKLVGTVEELY